MKSYGNPWNLVNVIEKKNMNFRLLLEIIELEDPLTPIFSLNPCIFVNAIQDDTMCVQRYRDPGCGAQTHLVEPIQQQLRLLLAKEMLILPQDKGRSTPWHFQYLRMSSGQKNHPCFWVENTERIRENLEQPGVNPLRPQPHHLNPNFWGAAHGGEKSYVVVVEVGIFVAPWSHCATQPARGSSLM